MSFPPRRARRPVGIVTERPFLLRALMLRQTADTLLGDDVSVLIRPPDPANGGAVTRRPSARNPGVTAPRQNQIAGRAG
jgi:hypothetical protein